MKNFLTVVGLIILAIVLSVIAINLRDKVVAKMTVKQYCEEGLYPNSTRDQVYNAYAGNGGTVKWKVSALDEYSNILQVKCIADNLLEDYKLCAYYLVNISNCNVVRVEQGTIDKLTNEYESMQSIFFEILICSKIVEKTNYY